MGENYHSDLNSKRNRKGRFTGDRWYYLILHNTISAFLFFALMISMNLFNQKTQFIREIFTINFVQLFIYVFALNIFTGLIGRAIAYIILYFLIVKWRHRNMKKIGEINYGIDSINFNYFIGSLLGSLLFSIGAVIILQQVLFSDSSIYSLIVSYLVMKGGVYLLVKVFNQVR